MTRRSDGEKGHTPPWVYGAMTTELIGSDTTLYKRNPPSITRNPERPPLARVPEDMKSRNWFGAHRRMYGILLRILGVSISNRLLAPRWMNTKPYFAVASVCYPSTASCSIASAIAPGKSQRAPGAGSQSHVPVQVTKDHVARRRRFVVGGL